MALRNVWSSWKQDMETAGWQAASFAVWVAGDTAEQYTR